MAELFESRLMHLEKSTEVWLRWVRLLSMLSMPRYASAGSFCFAALRLFHRDIVWHTPSGHPSGWFGGAKFSAKRIGFCNWQMGLCTDKVNLFSTTECEFAEADRREACHGHKLQTLLCCVSENRSYHFHALQITGMHLRLSESHPEAAAKRLPSCARGKTLFLSIYPVQAGGF